MTKILFITPSLSGGGAERVVAVLASELSEAGYDTHVIVYHKAKNEYPHSNKIKLYNLSSGYLDDYKKLGMKEKIKKLRLLVNSIKPEFIIPFLPQVGFHTWVATFGRKYKIIQTVRNNPATDPPVRYERWIRNVMFFLSWRNFVQNYNQIQYFPKVIRHKTSILPNPVSNELFKIKHNYKDTVKTIVAMGRLTPQKNFELLINAAVELHKNYSDIQFNIYGDGEMKKYLYNKICMNNAQDFINLCGETSSPYEKLNNGDIFVLSSNYEGMPNVLLESMALGLPVISTDCPTGPSDIIINGKNGELISVGAVQELVDRLTIWIENPTLLKPIGQEARKTIYQNFSAKVIMNKFLKDVLCI